MKLVKFNLIVDEEKCRTVEELRDNFNLINILEHFESGKLEKWLKVRKYEELEVIKTIDRGGDTLDIAKRLCEVFEIDIDGETLKEEIEVYRIVNNGDNEQGGNIECIKIQKENQKLREKCQIFQILIKELSAAQEEKANQAKTTELSTWEDNETGLVWEIKDWDNIYNKYSWNQASEYAKELSSKNAGGFSDWRVPTKRELETLVSKNKFNYLFIIAPLSNNANSSGYYWSSTTYAVDIDRAWIVNFKDGRTYYNFKANEHCVRCVRGGQ